VWKIERISLLRQRLFPCCACPEPVLVKQSSFFNIEMAAEKGVVSRTVQVDQAEHSCAEGKQRTPILGSIVECSLRLSRACLGKMMIVVLFPRS
jgi:hypothetical protein